MPALPRTKFDGVQSLRFVAALLVVITHATFYAGDRLDPSIKTWQAGGVGVDIFFVISGFVMLISTGGLADRKDGWKYFGMRRIVRIVPMYWIATTIKLLTLVVLPAVVLHAQLDPSKTVLSYLFLPSRNIDGDVKPLLGVGWTLIFEMFFYLVFTIALLTRAKPIWFCTGVLSICALANIVRPEHWVPALVYLDPIVLYFVVGMVIGRWVQDGSVRQLSVWMTYVIALWIVIPIADGELSGRDVDELIRHVCVATLVIVVVSSERWINGRIPKSILYMGDASYTLYLFHPLMVPIVPLALAFFGLGGEWLWLSIIVSILVASTGAAIIFRFVERPITRWLQAKLPYVRRHPVATVEINPTPAPLNP